MPDASNPRDRAPTGWGDAFAAMPQETPPADARARVTARLDARAANRHHARRRSARTAGWLGAAAAAAFALVVAWPRQEIVTAPAPMPTPTPMAVRAATPASSATLDASIRKPASDATAIALPKVVEAARKPRYAERRAPAPTDTPRPTASGATKATPAGAQRLDTLYAESARLEALLALARDDRVASAAAALLSAELDAQVAGIDVRLAQPGLDDAQRKALWQARVDALRQAAGFESTQRVLASQGDGGALIVSVD
jgi:hypothetical protein